MNVQNEWSMTNIKHRNQWNNILNQSEKSFALILNGHLSPMAEHGVTDLAEHRRDLRVKPLGNDPH